MALTTPGDAGELGEQNINYQNIKLSNGDANDIDFKTNVMFQEKDQITFKCA